MLECIIEGLTYHMRFRFIMACDLIASICSYYENKWVEYCLNKILLFLYRRQALLWLSAKNIGFCSCLQPSHII